MDARTVVRQRDRRYSILSPQKAAIEFSHGRRTWRLPLIDISIAGLAFAVEEKIPGLEPDLRLEAVCVRIAECEILGRLVIRHVTPQPDFTTHYGAMFYPEEEADLLKLNGVLAGIEAVLNR